MAGGSGLRMEADIPKQFIPLSGLPVLMHTIQKFHETIPFIQLLVVLPEAQQEYWKSLCQQYQFSIPYQLVNGGTTRFQSVRNGLMSIEGDEGFVAIHDGVRPFISKDIILRSFEGAEKFGNATAAVQTKDSLRIVVKDENKAVDRSNFRIIQTPQTFELAAIKRAFDTPELPLFTDDASVFEHAGHKIHLIEGGYENIKITTPEDLAWGELFFNKN